MSDYPRISDHVGHRWRKVRRPGGGGSVYCTCGPNVRLYQGACYNVEKNQRKLAEALDTLRDYLLAHPELLEVTP